MQLVFAFILRAVQGETFACSHARQSVGKRKPENPRSGERGYVSFLAVRNIFDPAHYKMYRRRELQRILSDAGHPHATIDRYKINWLWGLMTARSIKGNTT
jgi:hypothetical protein